MPRLTKSLPKYRKHKVSGQAIVTLDGKDFYLGPHGTKASHSEYDRLVGEWQANGRRLQESVDHTTIVELAAAFWRHAKQHYIKNGRPTDEQAGMRVCLRYLKETNGATPVADFGPVALKTIQQRMIDVGNSRGYINQNTSRIKHIFKWGVANELVPVEVFGRLTTVEGLREGKTQARESGPVVSVDDTTIEKTLPHSPQGVADMVSIQRLTGMRPGEVILMRPEDLKREHDVWAYTPKEHKMEHKRRHRTIFLGPKAQSILLPYLLRRSDAFCFAPKRQCRSCRYTVRTYRDTIHRACDKAFPAPEPLCRRDGESLAAWHKRLTPRQLSELKEWQKRHHWAPNQLRHTAGTEIRKQFGLEAAQVTLGHSNANVTQIYAERDMEKAAAIMREVG